MYERGGPQTVATLGNLAEIVRLFGQKQGILADLQRRELSGADVRQKPSPATAKSTPETDGTIASAPSIAQARLTERRHIPTSTSAQDRTAAKPEPCESKVKTVAEALAGTEAVRATECDPHRDQGTEGHGEPKGVRLSAETSFKGANPKGGARME